ncbi:hypothetical protein HQ590_15810 [bacterium]|nr:hypothetical protein [bacterium]
MREILNVTFESGTIPADWVETKRLYRFEHGALRTGAVTRFEIPLPGAGWRGVRVEAELEILSTGAPILTCSDGRLRALADLRRGKQTISIHDALPLAQGSRPVASPSGTCLAAFDFNDARPSFSIDGKELLSGHDPQPVPVGGMLELEFWDDCRVRRIRILGDGALDRPRHVYPPRTRSDFSLEVCVDFLDDLLYAPYDAGMFDRLFAEFARWGVQRCHWIHYGTKQQGLCDHMIGSSENYLKTCGNVGEILPTAVRAAQAHGIQLYGLFKPFEMGVYYSDGEGTPDDQHRTRQRHLGGGLSMLPHFCVDHPELMMARKPGAFGPAAKQQVYRRIDLVKSDDRPGAPSVQDLRLYVSEDNNTYRLYQGPLEREERVEEYPVWEPTASGGRPTGQTRRARVLRLKNLDLRRRYVALYVEGREGRFSNSLINLIHVFGERGEERRLTYGVLRRTTQMTPDVNGGLLAQETDFRDVGVEFDVSWGGLPSAVTAGDYLGRIRALDSGEGFLAFAAGKERSPIGRPSPSFPAVREYWLGWVRDILDAGADGVELRIRNHSYHLAWAEFGFEPPVRDEFLRRYGVDLWQTDDFDRVAWRKLRGEGYTEFVRQARQLCTSRQKPLGLHVSPTLEMDPVAGAAMEIHWDWRTWLTEGLADSVTLKEIWPKTDLAEEVLALTRPRGIATIFCPYAANSFRDPGGERVIADWIRLAREGGGDGYQFYECAAVIKGTSDGRILMEQPALRTLLHHEFAK